MKLLLNEILSFYEQGRICSSLITLTINRNTNWSDAILKAVINVNVPTQAHPQHKHMKQKFEVNQQGILKDPKVNINAFHISASCHVILTVSLGALPKLFTLYSNNCSRSNHKLHINTEGEQGGWWLP